VRTSQVVVVAMQLIEQKTFTLKLHPTRMDRSASSLNSNCSSLSEVAPMYKEGGAKGQEDIMMSSSVLNICKY
jgi:hypothetical protein